MNLINRLIKGEEGQGMTEYGLLLAVVVVAVVAALSIFNDELKDLFTDVFNKIDTAVDGMGKKTP